MPVVFEDFYDVGGFATDRQFARPDKSWPARLRLNEWKTVCIHLGLGQGADDELRQKNFDEGILLEDHALTVLGTQIAKDRSSTGWKVFPVAWLDHRLHVSDGA